MSRPDLADPGVFARLMDRTEAPAISGIRAAIDDLTGAANALGSVGGQNGTAAIIHQSISALEAGLRLAIVRRSSSGRRTTTQSKE